MPARSETDSAESRVLPGETRMLHARSGPLCLRSAGAGAPMLLIHSINAAPSAYEIAPIYEHFRTTRRTYAVDLPGFGASDRSDRRYDVRLYVDAIHDALDAIESETEGAPVDVLALSLSAEFAARATHERPDRVRSLALVTPTGFDARSSRLEGEPGSTREIPGLHALVTVPLWRRALFGLLTRPATIRYFLGRTFGGGPVDDRLVEQAVRTARAPGAEHAPLTFLSGRLFSADVRSVHAALPGPVWLAHGTRGDFSDFSGADWARHDRRFTVEAFPTGAMPHFETPDRFMAAYEAFLERVVPHSTDDRG